MPRFFICCYILILFSCRTPLTRAIFKPVSPHEKYQNQLKTAGLSNTLLYKKWVTVAEENLVNPSPIKLPHLESGYFSADEPQAVGLVFTAIEGEQVSVELTFQSEDTIAPFVDLWEVDSSKDRAMSFLVALDSSSFIFTYDVRKTGQYVVRIQPQLLQSCSYQLKVTAEPSLGYPVAASANARIGSFFGDGREGNRRKHEGVDIFAPRGTPAIASASGVVSRVGTNNLGGKVVWLRTKERNLSLYYAHLDTQLVQSGLNVLVGDTLGLIGNTGNARTTSPHLHFGIYRIGGAIDPKPFLKPEKSNPTPIRVNKHLIGDTVRLVRNVKIILNDDSIQSTLLKNNIVKVDRVTGRTYGIILPNGRKGQLPDGSVVEVSSIINKIKLSESQLVYAQPDSASGRITNLPSGSSLNVLGTYNNFHLIAKPRGWISIANP